MHHPGPPRFTSVGETVELAPRAPDPEASYRWTLTETPSDSTATFDERAVQRFTPDTVGIYRATLETPTESHDLTIRAFPDERRPVRFAVHADRLPQMEEMDVTGTFNDHRLGIAEPDYADHVFSYETRLPPGEHEAVFVPDRDFREAERTTEVVEGPERPRISLDATVEDGHAAFEATPRASPGTDERDEDLDVEFYVDDRDRPEFDADLEIDGTTATCPTSALPEQLRVHAVAVGQRHSIADAVTVHRDGTVERPNDPPEWVEDATLYSIFTRSFVGEPDATFAEIERRIPYLEWLGIDALWMTPILSSRSPPRDDDGFERGGPHGYHTLDYFAVAPDLGTREDLESLVEACHDHGIKVVFDLVINHTSRHHPWFQMASAGMPEYEERYLWTDDGEPETYFAWSSIPNLDYTSLTVRDHLLSVVDEWAEVVDGFRCDVAWGVPHGFWKEVRQRVKAADSDFLMLDETIPRDPKAHEQEFDLHYDTELYGTLTEIGQGEAPASDLLDAVEAEAREGFPESAVQMRYIENHDETRYLKACDRAAQKAATAATFTLPGVPMLYYGQETGMLSFRGAMDWGGDEELTTWCRTLSLAREDLDVLRHGEVEPVEYSVETNTDGPEDEATENVVAFARETDDRRVVVVLNFGPETADVTLSETVETTDLLTGDSLAGEAESATVTVDSAGLFEA